MSELDLVTSVRLARAGAAVERCHAHQNLLRYTVGHHSNDMVTMITLAWLEEHGTLPRSELLVAAAFHDVPERIVGDIPHHVKKVLGPEVGRIEKAILGSMRVDVDLTPEEERWLKLADGVELMLWAHEEWLTRGNVAFKSWVTYYLKKFNADWKDIPSAWRRIITTATEGHVNLPENQILAEAMSDVDE